MYSMNDKNNNERRLTGRVLTLQTYINSQIKNADAKLLKFVCSL